MLEPIVKRCVGLDVNKMVVVATALTQEQDALSERKQNNLGLSESIVGKWCVG